MYVRATFGKFSHSLSTQLRCKPMDKRPVGINNYFDLFHFDKMSFNFKESTSKNSLVEIWVKKGILHSFSCRCR